MKNIQKFTIYFIFILAFSLVCADANSDSFISGMSESPGDYIIVKGEFLSLDEDDLVMKLSTISDISLAFPEEVFQTTNLIIIGSPEANAKTAELGNEEMGNYYVFNENLFLSGGIEENVDNLNLIIFELEKGIGAVVGRVEGEEDVVSDDGNGGSGSGGGSVGGVSESEEDSSVEEQTSTKNLPKDDDIIVGKEVSSSGKTFNFYFSMILGIIALGIVILFIVLFLKKPRKMTSKK